MKNHAAETSEPLYMRIHGGRSKKYCGISAAGIRRAVRPLSRQPQEPLARALSNTTSTTTSPTTTNATLISTRIASRPSGADVARCTFIFLRILPFSPHPPHPAAQNAFAHPRTLPSPFFFTFRSTT